MRRQGRRYRINAEGQEVPIWASRERLERMAHADALNHHQKGYPLCTIGNTTYDAIYTHERARLAGEKT